MHHKCSVRYLPEDRPGQPWHAECYECEWFTHAVQWINAIRFAITHYELQVEFRDI